MASGAPATETEDETESIESTVQHAASLFKALADPLRLQLIALTHDAPGGEVCFCDLIDVFTLPQSSLSYHLRVLVTAGVLDRERRGTWSWYRLRPDALAVLQDALQPDGTLTRKIRSDVSRTRPPSNQDHRPDERCADPRGGADT